MNGEMVRKWLRLERRERGWNQDDLAEAAGIKSRTTIRKLESGLKLSEGVEGAVEQALGWELGDLDRIRSGGQPTRSDAAGSKDLARMTYEEILSAAMGVEKTRGEVAAQRVLVAWVVARDEMLKERGRVDEPPLSE